jgi:hypothetical protein
MPSVLSKSALLCAAFAFAISGLGGCLVKEKKETPAASALVPPWDPAKFAPKKLEGPGYADSARAFAVFDSIARIDSLAGDPKEWKPEKGAIDTLRIEDLFDTAFVFPQNPDAAMPYAYDDSYRDDTLWRNAYGNGLFTQDHPCALNYVLSGQFLHPAKWLKRGLKEEDIEAALGKPLYRQAGALRYLSKHPGPRPERSGDDSSSTAPDSSDFEVYEGVNLYFADDSLFAAVLQKSQPCH